MDFRYPVARSKCSLQSKLHNHLRRAAKLFLYTLGFATVFICGRLYPIVSSQQDIHSLVFGFRNESSVEAKNELGVDHHVVGTVTVTASVTGQPRNQQDVSTNPSMRHLQEFCHQLPLAACQADPICNWHKKSSQGPVCRSCKSPPCHRKGQKEVNITSLLARSVLLQRGRRFPVKVGGVWPGSGLPYMDEVAKARKTRETAGLQLILGHVDVSDLKVELQGQPEKTWDQSFQAKNNVIFDGKQGNLEKFKPNVTAQILIFSDKDGNNVYQCPWFMKYQALLDPILDQLLGEAKKNIIRLQLARMSGSAVIKSHVDLGDYARSAHRIHVPILVGVGVKFFTCPPSLNKAGEEKCISLQLEEGLAFELNNRVPHSVTNSVGDPRVHLVIDVKSNGPIARGELRPGQQCTYDGGKIACQAGGFQEPQRAADLGESQ